jgi:methanogenic corrinoid protein MtbC1
MLEAIRCRDLGGNAIYDSLRLAAPLPAVAAEDQKPAKRNWMDLLDSAIESEVLPRLLSAQRASAGVGELCGIASRPSPDDVASYVALIVADDMDQARAEADRVIVQYGGRDALLHDLLTPAARLLGEMWERDECDFMTVTLGVYRLNQVMKETATVGPEHHLCSYDHQILLVPAPGEQHGFGLAMVADVFREGGWCVRSGPAISRAQLLRLVRTEWFDVIALSASSDRSLDGLAACIRAVRNASCNSGAFIMVGGHAVVCHPERQRFLGADAAPVSAAAALAAANDFVETTKTKTLRQPNARLVDAR